ncbi:MAG: MerR family transcriptional regulator [Armatimonadetes bacterium]|nr:MerR family transcriptional regulator [Armatimonadota bacterium]
MGRRERKDKVPIDQRPVSISVASRLTGVETHTLRYWEKEFEDFLNPVRTGGGQRRYRPEDIETIAEIRRLLKDEMFSIAGARRALLTRMNGSGRKNGRAKTARN